MPSRWATVTLLSLSVRQRTLREQCLDDPKTSGRLFGFDERAVGEDRLVAAPIDHRRDCRVGEAGGENLMAAGDQLLFERVDRNRFSGCSRFAAVVDGVDQILHGFILTQA